MRGLFSQKIFSVSPSRRRCLAVLAALSALTGQAQAGDWFNPAFLAKEAGAVADLSRFDSGAGQPAGTYRVDVWMNDEFITTSGLRFDTADGKVPLAVANASQPGDDTGLRPCLTVNWLHKLGVNTDLLRQGSSKPDAQTCVDVAHFYPGATSRFDFSAQRLMLAFPQALLNHSARGYIPPEEWDQGINAGLLNYTLTGQKSQQSSSHYFNLDGGMNLGGWRLRHNGAWSDTRYNNGDRQSHWQNIANYAQHTVIPLKSELVVGDSSSSAMLFEALAFRGIGLHSAESMYPDSQQGYAPTVRGIAPARARVTVRQNGYLIYQNVVQAGAFAISDLSPASGSGDFDVTVEADGGGVQHFTVPYATVPLLQREGHSQYEAIVGHYRSGASSKGTPLFAQGTWLYGLHSGTTIYAGMQIADRYQSGSAGAGRNLGELGAISADVTSARSRLVDGSEHQGQSLRLLYAKSLGRLGTSLQLLGYRYSTRGFYTLDEVAWDTMQGYQYAQEESADRPQSIGYHNLHRSKKGRFQLNLTQQLKNLGSLYLAATQQTYWNAAGNDFWYQVGFASSWHGISYNLGWSVNRGSGLSGTQRLLSLNISIPFGQLLAHRLPENSALNEMYATVQANRDRDGNAAFQSGVSGTLLTGKNLSYSLLQGHSTEGGADGNLNASWHSSYGTAGGGYSYDRHGNSLNWDLSGGVVAHADGITLSQRLGESNVLVKAPGASNVQIENQTGVKTDGRGYAVMPYASVYRRNRVALDVNSLDRHTDLDGNVQNVVPTEGALVRAEYVTHVGLRALITLIHDGHPVPFGSTVSEPTSGATGIVSDGGLVYLSAVPLTGRLEAVWGNRVADRCTAPFQFPAGSENSPAAQLTLICRSGK